MLTSVGLVERVRAGSRRDHFRLRDDAWAVLYTNQNEVAAVQMAAKAASRRPDESLARHRLTQMRDFYDFLLKEIPTLLDRWRQR